MISILWFILLSPLVAVALFYLRSKLRTPSSMEKFKNYSRNNTNSTSPLLLSRPFTLPCGITIPNRIIKAATTEGLATRDGNPSELNIKLYSKLAECGQIGLVITGNIMVDKRYMERAGNIYVDEKTTDVAKFKAWASGCTNNGAARCIVQLGHPGRQANPFVSPQPIAPSAIGITEPVKMAVPREMTLPEIQDVIARFGKAAKVVADAGFDGVQVHGAHGYLISQFLSPSSNQRKDKYGGSLENRARLLLECIAAARDAVGPHKIVSCKLNSADFSQGGFEAEDSMKVVKMLCEQGIVDLIEISGGNYESMAVIGAHIKEEREEQKPSAQTKRREAYFREYARDAKKVIDEFKGTRKPAVMLTGGMRSVEVIEKVLQENEADFVGIARPLAIEPTLVKDMIEGKVVGASLLRPYIPKSLVARARVLFGVGETAWYGEQNRRLAEGKEPDPEMNVFGAIARVVVKDAIEGTLRKLGL